MHDSSTSVTEGSVVLVRELTSFWRENVVAVVILLRVLAKNIVEAGTSYQM